MGIHNRRRVLVSGTALASEVKAFTRRPEWQYFLALGQVRKLIHGLTGVVLRLAFAVIHLRGVNARQTDSASVCKLEGVAVKAFGNLACGSLLIGSRGDACSARKRQQTQKNQRKDLRRGMFFASQK